MLENIGVWAGGAGGGARGAAAPPPPPHPKFRAAQIFWAAREGQFLKTSPFYLIVLKTGILT